jgi:hypothetical protein
VSRQQSEIKELESLCSFLEESVASNGNKATEVSIDVAKDLSWQEDAW